MAELCREHGMCSASFYKWRAKYGGMEASLISQMKAIEDKNQLLMRMYADLSMQADLLKEALGKKWRGHLNALKWPRKRWRDTGSALRWLAGPSGSARLLSLQPTTEGRERRDCRTSGWADGCPQDPELRPVFPAFAQLQRPSLEPQARKSHLLCAGAEPADQATQATVAREVRCPGGAGHAEHELPPENRTVTEATI